MKLFINVRLLSVMVYGTGCLAQLQARAQVVENYLVRYASVGCQTEIKINGITILTTDKGGGQIPISNLLTNGTNSIQVSSKVTDPRFENFELRLVTLNDSNQTENVLFECPPPADHNGVRSIETTGRFSAKIPFKWTWEEGSYKTNLSRSDQAEIYSVIEQVGDALRKKDLKRYNELQAAFIADCMRSEGVSSNSIAERIREVYEPLFAGKSFTVTVRPVEQLKMTPYGRITVVEGLATTSGNWIIEMVSDEQHYSLLHLMFSDIRGKWRIMN
jgi:hypothetical protein